MWANKWAEINEWFNSITYDIKAFFLEHCRNPLLWVAIIIASLLIFEAVYSALHRD